jgi:hypothetical protein
MELQKFVGVIKLEYKDSASFWTSNRVEIYYGY